MKGVILAGGLGTRLMPLTKAVNKHLLPLNDEPILYHPVKRMVEAGITEILVITGTEYHGQILMTLGSGSDLNAKILYGLQEKPAGIADAVKVAAPFTGNDPFLVLLGDNVFEKPIKKHVDAFRKQKNGARVLLKEVHDPQRYGIAELKKDKVISIEEKPKKPKTNLAVIGAYFYDSNVYDIIAQQKPSARGEYEITDVNNAYIKNNNLEYDIYPAEWTDAGTFPSLAKANEILKR